MGSTPAESSSTSELPALPTPVEFPLPSADTPPPRITFGAVTHPGLVRRNNEDQFAVVRRTRSREILLTSVRGADPSLVPPDHAYVLVIADGLGGGACGELASELVLRFGWELAGRQPRWLMRFTPSEWPAVQETLGEFSEKMQFLMREYSANDARTAGMGTTWTCAYLVDWHLIVAHVGDTRAYLLRGGRLEQLTTDHTMAQKLKEMGIPEQDTTKFRHILTNAFGCNNEQVTIDSLLKELQPGDRLLLCSDGLYDMSPDALIQSELLRFEEPQAAADALLKTALAAGGRDNVTIVVADFHAV